MLGNHSVIGKSCNGQTKTTVDRITHPKDSGTARLANREKIVPSNLKGRLVSISMREGLNENQGSLRHCDEVGGKGIEWYPCRSLPSTGDKMITYIAGKGFKDAHEVETLLASKLVENPEEYKKLGAKEPCIRVLSLGGSTPSYMVRSHAFNPKNTYSFKADREGDEVIIDDNIGGKYKLL